MVVVDIHIYLVLYVEVGSWKLEILDSHSL